MRLRIKLASIVVRRLLRQLIGVSTPWQNAPLVPSNRPYRESGYIQTIYVVLPTYPEQFRLTREEWNDLMWPFRRVS